MNTAKRIFKCLLFIILIIAITTTYSIPVQANTKIKLKNSKITMTAGQTKGLKVIGTKKKVRWTSSNTKIATVNKKGRVKARRKGSCKIYARVGKKKLVCKVTVSGKKSTNVNKNTNTNTSKNNVSYRSYGTNHGVVILVKNNYSYTVDVDVDCMFYDSNGTMIEKSSDHNFGLESGKECALFAWISHSNWSSHKINLKVDEAKHIASNVSGIGLSYNVGNKNVMVKVKNNGKKNEFTKIAVVFYKKNKVVGYESQYADVRNPGATDYLEFSFPYDWDYDMIAPDRYVVYVNYSYAYR